MDGLLHDQVTSDPRWRAVPLDDGAPGRSPTQGEFHQDVARVPRNREPGVSIKQIDDDFDIAESCLRNWLRASDVEDGVKTWTPSPTEIFQRIARSEASRLLKGE